MALYHNATRFEAIVTIRIIAAPEPKEVLEIGLASAKKIMGADVGVHDLRVGPGESIELKQGVDAEFLAARGV